MDTGTEVIHAEREVEVWAKAGRRRLTAEYKRRVLQEADACTKPRELGLCCGGRGCTRRTCLGGGRPDSGANWQG